jgi:glycerol-3-phosphate dehydrogenase
MELSYKDRAAALQHMTRQGVDILVVGGGITGAGVALDAAARGYRVGLVERADFASGTSSKSTKLVHGGIRYLPQFDFGLVHEALVERGLLIRNAPFLVQPIGFVLPLYAENKRPLGTPIVPPGGIGMSYLLQSGLLMYDLMSGRLGVRRHRRLGPRNALRLAPCLKTDGLKDAFIYYDAQTDDTRLTSTVIRTAAQHGAWIANYAEVTGFIQDGERITAAQVQDRVSGEALTIRAGTVVNAGGVFAGRIEALVGGESSLQVKPAKGVHLTVPRSVLRMGRDAIVLPETEDGRLLFIVPWGPRVTIGTTDTPGGDVDHPVADADDVAYLLRHIERYMSCRLTEADIISTWAGYRPLVSSTRSDAASSKLSRTHAVVESPGGMVTIVGGKLTTYRRMAQDTVDHISRVLGDPVVHVTEHLPLAGTMGWQEAAVAVKSATTRYNLQPDTARRLGLYGAEAGTILGLLADDPTLAERVVSDLPYIMAEVVYACRYELALALDDVLERRLHINFEDWARGREAAPAVAALMARELGWDAAETARQVENYRQRVDGTARNGAATSQAATP